ncbi:MAG TPA: TonB-dependent receptor [Bryobacteraceae bacterium]
MKTRLVGMLLVSALALVGTRALGQSISSGTITGTVQDPSGAAVPGAAVAIHNPITNYTQAVTTDNTGSFRFSNVPFNSYHLEAKAGGFAPFEQDVAVRSTVPLALDVKLALSGNRTTVEVEAAGSDLVENVPYAHNDVDVSTLAKLPTSSPASGLSDMITLSAPGVVADSNGFFHPLGDHAQTSYYVDGQPINDQQSKAFSTQMPENAFQNMELITGLPPAEFGDKTSLVVDAVTRSGLGKKAFGGFEADYGSFGAVSEKGSVGWGNARTGNFVVANATRSGRFLDSPEFLPIHDIGNNQTFFDRFDFQPNTHDAFHLNVFVARNWFQTPNTYDQPDQDQRQKVVSFNIAPGYQHTFGASTLLTLNPWVRRDDVNYYPSRDPFDDAPATLAQHRTLLNYGGRIDVSSVFGRHNFKVGAELKQTRLKKNFSVAITDPGFNPVCVDDNGDPALDSPITDPDACSKTGLIPNPDVLPGLIPFDLTRGGSLFEFHDTGNVNQFAFYAQDVITLGRLTLQAGVRVDRYDGIGLAKTEGEPRLGFSYNIKSTGTVLRGSYARTMETPYNENLLLSSAIGVGGLASNVFGAIASQPLLPGVRNQFNTGFQQAFGKYLLVDADYFWKYTDNGYDFDVLFNTPIAFPISWRKSKLDGVAARISTISLKGFQAFVTMGHTRSRFFGPENGGLIFNSPVDAAVFRIDHDQAFEQTTNLRYQRPHNGPWIDFTWRYDSGLVAGEVGSLEDALALTGAQQSAIGFFCGSQKATIANPITDCSANYGASRLRIPAEGTENDDINPPRIAPHHVFDISAGTDNLFHTERARFTLRFSVFNLTNQVALYNFLSTFSGTHFVTPRSYHAAIGIVF